MKLKPITPSLNKRWNAIFALSLSRGPLFSMYGSHFSPALGYAGMNLINGGPCCLQQHTGELNRRSAEIIKLRSRKKVLVLIGARFHSAGDRRYSSGRHTAPSGGAGCHMCAAGPSILKNSIGSIMSYFSELPVERFMCGQL